MAATNRASKIATLFKVAKKQYQPVKPPADRSVLEHMLYACCLEDSLFDAADIAFARLQQSFFDWNEVRVTTATELSEVMDGLNDPGGGRRPPETHVAFDVRIALFIRYRSPAQGKPGQGRSENGKVQGDYAICDLLRGAKCARWPRNSRQRFAG